MYPLRYVPYGLSVSDTRKQVNGLERSKRNYKKGIYTPRPKVKYPHKTSKFIKKVHLSMKPTRALSRESGCPLRVLKAIVKKGEGAYYSSGSRPNQTAQSWGYARLASSLTGGKAAAVDFHLLKDCKGKVLRLAKQARKTYKNGRVSAKHRVRY
jgi:hypothetical protein